MQTYKMEFLQSHDLNHWQLWTPVIGGIVLYVGLNIRIRRVEQEENK